MKRYIAMNTKLSRKAKNHFKKDFLRRYDTIAVRTFLRTFL